MSIHPSNDPASTGRSGNDRDRASEPESVVDGEPVPSGAVPITLISRSWVTVGPGTTNRIAA